MTNLTTDGEEDLQAFIDGAAHYFSHVTGYDAEVGTPYLRTADNPVLEFTGMIGVSGSRKGFVYFTADRALLENILDAHGEDDFCEANLADMVGEVANTISGNVRRTYGANFMISVPLILSGGANRVTFPAGVSTYIIPISWKQFEPRLLVCFE